MASIIINIILAMFGLVFCIYDVIIGHYISALLWALFAAYFIFHTVRTIKDRNAANDNADPHS